MQSENWKHPTVFFLWCALKENKSQDILTNLAGRHQLQLDTLACHSKTTGSLIQWQIPRRVSLNNAQLHNTLTCLCGRQPLDPGMATHLLGFTTCKSCSPQLCTSCCSHCVPCPDWALAMKQQLMIHSHSTSRSCLTKILSWYSNEFWAMLARKSRTPSSFFTSA